MARRHGSYGQILMDDAPPAEPGTPTPVLVASMNSWSLDLARDRADVTAFGDTNKQYVQGLPDISGDLGGFWDAPNIEIFRVALGDTAAFLKLIPSSLDPTYFFSGLAFLDANIEVDAGGAVTLGGSFAGAGPWTLEPPAA
jgi:hypothetical protein